MNPSGQYDHAALAAVVYESACVGDDVGNSVGTAVGPGSATAV